MYTPLTPELPRFLELVFSDPIELAISLRLEICWTRLLRLPINGTVAMPDGAASAEVNSEGTASAEADSKDAASAEVDLERGCSGWESAGLSSVMRSVIAGIASVEVDSDRGGGWEPAGLSSVSVVTSGVSGFGIGGVEGRVGPCIIALDGCVPCISD